jgi:hypothetical protein
MRAVLGDHGDGQFGSLWKFASDFSWGARKYRWINVGSIIQEVNRDVE